MKLVQFDGGKTGLIVQHYSGLHVIDIIGSLGVFAPGDPLIARPPQRYPETKEAGPR